MDVGVLLEAHTLSLCLGLTWSLSNVPVLKGLVGICMSGDCIIPNVHITFVMRPPWVIHREYSTISFLAIRRGPLNKQRMCLLRIDTGDERPLC